MTSRARTAAFTAAVASVCAPVASLHAQHADFASVDSAVQVQLREAGVPGAALVIVRGREVAHIRGFGIADPTGRPVTPQTPFYLGSTTKSFTALAVLQLVERGLVELDAPVQRYLPWFTLADSAVSRQITVRQLLLHRGRIPGRAGEYFLSDDDTSASAAERHVRWLARAKPTAGFDYNNLGYTTLGLIVEAASGLPYASYLRTQVFEPLGMRHTHTERADAERDGLAAGYAMVLGFPVPRRQPADRGDLAAGYLMSSAEDVGQYLVAQVNQGRVPGHAGVSSAVVEEMHQSRGPIVPDRDIAFGFSITTLEGVRILDISGSVPTYASRFVLSPDSGWAMALLTNANGAIAEAHIMEPALNAARMTMGKPPVPVNVPRVLRLVIGLAIALPFVQIALAARAVRRWRRPGASQSRRTVRTVLGSASGALWGLFVIAGLPVVFQSYWATMIAYQPDFATALLASGVLGLIWSVVRIGMALKTAPSEARFTYAGT